MANSEKNYDWIDIGAHVAPTIVMANGMAFMASYALRHEEGLWLYIMVGGAVFATLLFAYLWTRREKSQHEGRLGGRQSRLEAYAPLIAGPITFVIASTAFYIWDI